MSILDQFLANAKSYNPHPVLYSRTATGAIQTWQVEVENNKYRFITGQKNGQLITSDWTVCDGKNVGRVNETSGDAQAQKEAKAAQVKKLKSGGYWENEADIDRVRFIEPMLAYPLKNRWESVVYPIMVDRKYNGGRVVASRDGLKTRKGESYKTIDHIWNSINHLFAQFPDLVLDGEGYNHRLRFKLNELMSILRASKADRITPELLAKSEATVRYYVYDGYGFTVNGKKITEDTGCLGRRKALFELLKNVRYCVPVEYQIVNSKEELLEANDSNVLDGFEGSIVRTINAPYQHKRTNDLLKIKPMDDDEFVITGVEAGEGNWAGKAKRIFFRFHDGKIFKGSFKGTMEQAEKFLKEKNKWIGQKVTVHYFGFTGLGTPNFAQLDINNCLRID